MNKRRWFVLKYFVNSTQSKFLFQQLFIVCLITLLINIGFAWYARAWIEESLDFQVYYFQALRFIFISSAISLIIGGTIAFFHSLYFSYRILGPTRRIESFLDELLEEKWGQQLSLREGDEFEELANKLNKLSELLEKKKKL